MTNDCGCADTATAFVEALERKADNATIHLVHQQERLFSGIEQTISNHEKNQTRYAAELHALSPLQTFGRGYSIALDAKGAQTISVMPIPDEGLGESINDRLRRAAAPR